MEQNLTGPGPIDNQRTSWEARYREGDTPWDRGRSVPAVEEAAKFFPAKARVLVPGCGFGHDAARLAECGYSVEGWDLSPSAIRSARERYASLPVRFSCVDLLESGVEDHSFDAIFEHTFLCAIGPAHWERAACEFARLLKPEGYLFAILFTHLREEDPPPWAISTKQAEQLLGKEFLVQEVTEPKESLPGRENEETLGKFRRRAIP